MVAIAWHTRLKCRGCEARHHERCNGWTRYYADRGDGVVALVPCHCTCGDPDVAGRS